MRALIDIGVAVLLFYTVIAVDTNIAMINLTPYDWKQSKAPHAYQVSDWTSSFAPTYKANSIGSAKATFDLSGSPEDSGAEVSYQVTDETTGTIEIRLRVDDTVPIIGRLPGAEHIEIALNGIATSANPKGTTVRVGFNDGAWTPIILGGKKDSLVGNNPATNWMATNLNHFGCLTLESFMLPGSHDAGMSSFTAVRDGWANQANTMTQTHNIYDQLNFGARYFDIRPSRWKNAYYTGHWDNVDFNNLGWQGGLGQSISDIVNNINAFTSRSGNNELIILDLSHTVDVDNSHKPFTDSGWTAVLSQLTSSLNHLYVDNSGNNLTTIHLSSFIANGPAVVLICDERDDSWLKANKFSGKVYPKSLLPMTGTYANTADVSTMRNNQYAQLRKWSQNRQNSLFLLSWTMTMSGTGEAIGGAIGLDHLVDRANYANARLWEVASAPPTAGIVQWADFKNSVFPNIVLIDNYVDGNLATLLVAMNRYYHDCNGAK